MPNNARPARTSSLQRVEETVSAAEIDDAVCHERYEKIAPMANCRSADTTGPSRQPSKNKSGKLNLRSAVRTQFAFCLDVSVWNSHSNSPELRSRASRVPFRTPIKTTSFATAGDENI